MNRKLLLFVVCILSFSLLQAQRSAEGMTITKTNSTDESLIDEERPSSGVPVSYGILRGEEKQLGSSFNVYSVLLDGQNQVHYNEELEAMTFIHRQNKDAAVGGSGIISYDYSTDGGSTWNAENKPLTPTSDGSVGFNGNRYPSGTIYNPPGNTDPANAYFVGVGPALHQDPANGNGWGWEFVTSSPLVYDGTNTAEAYYTNEDSTSFHPYSLVSNPNGDIWYVSTQWDSDADGDQVDFTKSYAKFFLCKLTFNAGTSSFDREIVEVFEPNFDGIAEPSIGGSYQLAFSPDGMTGYFAYVCSDAENIAGLGIGVKPIMWKTTDGGATWAKKVSIDYSAMPELMDSTIVTDEGLALPMMSAYDMVVDDNGSAHLIAQMRSRSTSSIDSLGWSFAGPSATTIFHFITDGDIWSSDYVDIWENEVGEGAVGDVNAGLRLQATRTADGKFVAATYLKNCTDGTTCTEFSGQLLDPQIVGFAYDVDNDFRSDVKWISNVIEENLFNGKFLFATLAPVCIKDGDDKFIELPLAFPNVGATDLDPVDYFYLKGLGFTAQEMGMDDVSTENPLLDASLVDVFPNPTRGLLTIDLSELAENANITLTNAIGKTVMTNANKSGIVNMNISALPTGIYNLNIKVESGMVVKKVVLTK